MDGIRHAELTKSLSLQLQQFIATMVDSAANASVLPTCVLKSSQLGQFRAHRVAGPSILRQRQIAHDIRTRLYELRFQIRNGRAHLSIDLSADTGRAQE